MKTVLVAFYNVFPPDFGSASVTFNISKYLAGEKYLFHLGDLEDRVIEGNVNLLNIRRIPHNRFFKTIALFIEMPSIAKRIRDLRPDVLIMENASWAVHYLVLFYFIKPKKAGIKTIYHAHNVEYLLRRQKNNLLIAFFTRWAESILLKNADLSFSVSRIDAVNFKKVYNIEPKILPNGVDIEKFDLVNGEEVDLIRKKYGLEGKLVLFMGLPAFKPNKEAINLLIKKIFPLILKDDPQAKLVILGGEINYKRRWLINPGNIPFGEVPVLIKACDVCLAPIYSGSGVRLKILEYMAAAKPVVSSTKGSEGIDISDGENIIITDRAEEIARKTQFLLHNALIADEIGKKGKQLVSANYSWQVIMKTFNIVLSDFLHKND